MMNLAYDLEIDGKILSIYGNFFTTTNSRIRTSCVCCKGRFQFLKTEFNIEEIVDAETQIEQKITPLLIEKVLKELRQRYRKNEICDDCYKKQDILN